MDWSVAAAAESLRGGPLVKGGDRPVFFVFIQKSLLCGNDISPVHVKVLKGRKTRGEIAYLPSLGKMRATFRRKLLQERFGIPFIPPSQPRPLTLLIPSSFIYAPSENSGNLKISQGPTSITARELQHDNSPDSSPPGEGTSLSPASLLIIVTATSFRPGTAVCVVCDHSRLRLKSGSISISK